MGAFAYLIILGVATVIVFVASIVALASNTRATPDLQVQYNYSIVAMVASTLSLVLCIVLIVLTKVAPSVEATVSPYLSLVLFIVWVAGGGTCTFKYPFDSIGNGRPALSMQDIHVQKDIQAQVVAQMEFW